MSFFLHYDAPEDAQPVGVRAAPALDAQRTGAALRPGDVARCVAVERGWAALEGGGFVAVAHPSTGARLLRPVAPRFARALRAAAVPLGVEYLSLSLSRRDEAVSIRATVYAGPSTLDT